MKKRFFLLIGIFSILTGWILINPKPVKAGCNYPLSTCSGNSGCEVGESCRGHRCGCSTGYRCVSGTCEPYHLACQDNITRTTKYCWPAAGAGPNTCSSDSACRCTDSDGGQNIWAKGTATCPAVACNYPGTWTDYCSPGVIPRPDGSTPYVVEVFCDRVGGGTEVRQVPHDCRDYGAICQNGRCVRVQNTPTPRPPTSTPTPRSPTATPTPSRSCSQECRTRGYPAGTCRNWRCRSGEANLGRSVCSRYYQRCCCQPVPTSTPRPTSIPRPTSTPIPTPTSTPTPTPVVKVISGTVFYDLDKNGVKDVGEECFDGRVKIWIDSDFHFFDSTPGCNQYSYTVSGAGSHQLYIEPVPSGYTRTGYYGDDDGNVLSCQGADCIYVVIEN